MIYTIGHKKSYEQYFEEDALPKKKGKDVDYEGGSVFLTIEAATKYCPENYDIYGVDADWEKDTENIGEEYNALLVDSKLIKLN